MVVEGRSNQAKNPVSPRWATMPREERSSGLSLRYHGRVLSSRCSVAVFRDPR